MAELLPEQANLLSRPQPGNSNAWFEGAHLLPLLRKVLTLPDGPETDLLQYLDRLANIRHNRFSCAGYRGNLLSIDLQHRIMESLNLLRYLVIRDKVTENQVSLQPRDDPPTSRHVLTSVFRVLADRDLDRALQD